MYQSTAEEYTWLQIASHTASYSILPSQVTKAFQKNPVSLQGAKYHDTTFTLVFNPSLVCCKFLSIFYAHLRKAPHCKHRGGFCTWQTYLDASPPPSQDNIQTAVTTSASTPAIKTLLPDQPSNNHSPPLNPYNSSLWIPMLVTSSSFCPPWHMVATSMASRPWCGLWALPALQNLLWGCSILGVAATVGNSCHEEEPG